MTTDLSFIRQMQYDLGMKFFSPSVFDAYLSENSLPHIDTIKNLNVGKMCIEALKEERHSKMMSKREKDVILQHLTSCYVEKRVLSDDSFDSWREESPNPQLIHTSHKIFTELQISEWNQALSLIDSSSLDIQKELHHKTFLKNSIKSCQSYLGFKDLTSKEYEAWFSFINRNAASLCSFSEYDFTFKDVLEETNREHQLPDRTQSWSRSTMAEVFQDIQAENNKAITESFYTKWRSQQPVPTMYPEFSVLKRKFHPLTQFMREYDILYTTKKTISVQDVFSALEFMFSDIGWRDYRRATYAHWRKELNTDDHSFPSEYEILNLFGGWRKMIEVYREECEKTYS